MKRKRKTSKKEPQTKAKAMDRQYKEQKPLPLTLPLTIVLPDGTHKVITEEDLPELPVKTEDLNKLEHPIKKEEDQAVIDFDDVNEVKEEEPPPAKRGRKDDWTKTSYIKLENAEKGLQRMKKSSAFKLAQDDEEDEANAEENKAPYREAQRGPLGAFEYTGSQKKHSFPTIAHNYTFWADLIFEPKSRTRGMVLFVEGTSRWCWCHPFKNKSAGHIASVVEKFVKAIDERITCLVTDAGKEWQGIPPLTEEYGFVWKRKNVTLTGHGAMARLDRTVRTLRWYMFLIWLYKGGELTNWYKLFSLAVRHFNTVPHQFSPIPPKHLVRHPYSMHCVRRDEYIKGYRKYNYFDPYFTVGIGMLNGKRTRKPLPTHNTFYVEVDKDKPEQRYKYRTFEKGANRHLFRAEPRRVRYVVGNKFILDGDAVVNTANEAQHSITQGLYDPNSDKLFDARQLLLVDRDRAGEAQRGREQEGVERAQQAELGMTFGHLFDNTEDEEEESDGEVEKYFR